MALGTTQRETASESLSILWVTPDKPDNISTGRARIADGLRDRGHEVTQIADRKEALTAARDNYDVCISTTAWGGVVGPVAKTTGAAYVVDYVDPVTQLYRSAGTPMGVIGHALHTAAFAAADTVLHVYDSERGRVRLFADDIRRTTLGVDYDRFASPDMATLDAGGVLLDEAGVTGDFAVYIGGLTELYNIREMVDAFRHTDHQLVVAGTGSQQDIVEFAAQTYANVTYLGVVDHEIIPGILHHASAGICLVDDPHTVKVLEYAAAGLPVVHARGRAEGILPDQTFWTGTTPHEIAEQVELAMDSGTTPALAYDEYARAHDYQRVIDDYETALREACA